MAKKKGTPAHNRHGGTEQCTTDSTPKRPEPAAPQHTEAPQTASATPAYDPTRLAQRLLDFIGHYVVMKPDYLRVVVLWVLHTWVYDKGLNTSPRLVVSSITAGCGKSTLFDLLRELCPNAAGTSSLTPSVLVDMADEGGTLFIDEANRVFMPRGQGYERLLQIFNDGFSSRGMGVQRKEARPDGKNGYNSVRRSTFAPMALAGNNPKLAPDAMSRCIRIVLQNGEPERELDWDVIEDEEPELAELKAILPDWADGFDASAHPRPDLQNIYTGNKLSGRQMQVWRPLARIAQTQAGDWLGELERIASEYVEALADSHDLEEPHVTLLRNIAPLLATQWQGEAFIPSQGLCDALGEAYPEEYGFTSKYARLTTKRLGIFMRRLDINPIRNSEGSKRGYSRTDLEKVIESLHLQPPRQTEPPTPACSWPSFEESRREHRRAA